MPDLQAIRDRLTTLLETRSAGLRVAGTVAGVAVGGQQVTVAHGSANLNTGQPFTSDTGFLLGSVTKVLMTTALLRLVEAGAVDLDAPVACYVPEFTLRDAEAARAITVRMLLNHTNGIDSDSLCPTAVRGRDASKSYTEHLAKLGVVFEPGQRCARAVRPRHSHPGRTGRVLRTSGYGRDPAGHRPAPSRHPGRPALLPPPRHRPLGQVSGAGVIRLT